MELTGRGSSMVRWLGGAPTTGSSHDGPRWLEVLLQLRARERHEGRLQLKKHRAMAVLTMEGGCGGGIVGVKSGVMATLWSAEADEGQGRGVVARGVPEKNKRRGKKRKTTATWQHRF
jgi:hypothetical protein